MKTSEALKNEEGLLMVEAMLLLIVFFVFVFYVFDFFTIIHKGIVNQTHARTYLFESLQHRSKINVMRNEPDSPANFGGEGFRFHAVTNEYTTSQMRIIASDATLRHAENVAGEDNTRTSTTRPMIKTGYGICVNRGCE